MNLIGGRKTWGKNGRKKDNAGGTTF